MPNAISDIMSWSRYMPASAIKAPKTTGNNNIGKVDLLRKQTMINRQENSREMPIVNTKSCFICLELNMLWTGGP